MGAAKAKDTEKSRNAFLGVFLCDRAFDAPTSFEYNKDRKSKEVPKMAKFIEEFFYSSIDPQSRSTNGNCKRRFDLHLMTAAAG